MLAPGDKKMDVRNLKNLSYTFFPELTENFKAKEAFNKIDLIFHKLVMSETEEKFLKIAKEVHKISRNKTNKKYYPNALRELNNVVALGEAIIFNPKDYALLLDQELNKLFVEISKVINHEEQTQLVNLLVLNSFNCACVSLFAIIENNLNEEEKQKQFLIQQTRLNLVIQNDIKKENEANYWYSLHWFLKGNKNNAAFYLKKMVMHKTKMAILTEDDNMLWMKNKLPKEFLSFVKEEYIAIKNK